MNQSIKLAGKTVVVKPLTWGEVPVVLSALANALEGMDNIRKAFFHFVTQKPDEKSLMGEVMAAFPGLVTEALALGLRVDVDLVNAATPDEVLHAIEVCIEVHKLKELLERGKKVRSLLAAPLQPAVQVGAPKKPNAK